MLYSIHYTIALHSILEMQILVFEHIVFSISSRPGRGLAASSSTSNRVNSKWFKYKISEKMELYSTVASDGGYLAL